MRKLRGVLTSALWALSRMRVYFVKVSWFAIGALLFLAAYLYSEVRLGFRNRAVTQITAAELTGFVPSRGTQARVAGDFHLVRYWVGKEDDSEIYYSLLSTPTGSILARSPLPVERRIAMLEGTFEPLDPDVRREIAGTFPGVPGVVLHLGKRPLPLQLSLPALLLVVAVLAHTAGVLFGAYGFRPRPLPANSRELTEKGVATWRSRNYLPVTWANRSLGDLEAAAVIGNDALHVVTSVSRSYEVADVEFEGSNRTLKAVLPFRDIQEMTFGTVPVWLEERAALLIRGRTRVVLFSKTPEPLLAIMSLVRYLREHPASSGARSPAASTQGAQRREPAKT